MDRIIFLLTLIFGGFSGYSQNERTLNFPKRIEYPEKMPHKQNVWVFMMAGQSNMAGRGTVEPQDTIPNPRILSILRNNEIIVAKEPLHFYEPNLTGLDCGLAFGKHLIKEIADSITILLVPTAVGGSSTHQWLGDSLHRNVQLLSNFKSRLEIAKKYGVIKGILWHQGESDTNSKLIPGYEVRLQKIFTTFRSVCGDATLPILVGELGSYSENQINWNLINDAIHRYASKDKNVIVVDTGDLKSKEDKIHFDSAGQRMMGERMAKKFLTIQP
jgi:hypothetical protein